MLCMYTCTVAFSHIIYMYSHALCVMCDVYSCICTCRSVQLALHAEYSVYMCISYKG